MTSFRQDSDSRGGCSSSTRPQKRKYLLTNFHMFLLSFIDVHTQTQTNNNRITEYEYTHSLRTSLRRVLNAVSQIITIITITTTSSVRTEQTNQSSSCPPTKTLDSISSSFGRAIAYRQHVVIILTTTNNKGSKAAFIRYIVLRKLMKVLCCVALCLGLPGG